MKNGAWPRDCFPEDLVGVESAPAAAGRRHSERRHRERRSLHHPKLSEADKFE
jgi:hypothetical protein